MTDSLVFEPWLFAIARNLTIDHMRRRKTWSLVADLDSDDGGEQHKAPRAPASNDPSPFALAARTEDAQRLAQAMQTLDFIYREVLVLRFQEDLSLQEVATVVGAPVSTVASRIYRGLQTITNPTGWSKSMKTDPHATFRDVIDKTLAGGASPEEEPSLQEHVAACTQCQEYLMPAPGSSPVLVAIHLTLTLGWSKKFFGRSLSRGTAARDRRVSSPANRVGLPWRPGVADDGLLDCSSIRQSGCGRP